MSTPKLYMNSREADAIIAEFPSMEQYIHVIPQYQPWFEDEWQALIDRLNQNREEGKPIAPVKIREEKTAYWLAGNGKRR